MNKKDRDIFDDLIHSKLHDFEMDSLPENTWDKIAEHLPQTNHQAVSRNLWHYWVSAAAVSLLLMIGGIYFYDGTEVQPVIADVIEQETEEIKSRILEEKKSDLVINDPYVHQSISNQKAETPLLAKEMIIEKISELPTPDVAPEGEMPVEEIIETIEKEEAIGEVDEALVTPVMENAYIVQAPVSEKKRKRWSFGVGGMGVSANSESFSDLSLPVANAAYNGHGGLVENWHLLNIVALNDNSARPIKTDVKHNKPLSVGFSASYSLTDRWFLQLGLTYSFLKSEWKTGDVYSSKMDQRLHFVGLPVSIAYKLKEWNKFMFYTSAGVKPEVNFAGRLKDVTYFEGIKTGHSTGNLRMKEWYWSANAGVGVSYPLFRYVNAFAEVGAGYYFDNGSSIETIHSSKPFKANLGLGLRFGF